MSRARLVAGEVRHLAGWKKEMVDHRDWHLPMKAADVTVPAMVPKLPDLAPVKNQLDAGTCTANAGTDTMEYLEHKGAADKLFSVLDLYANTRAIEGTPLAEDSGAQIRSVMKALATYGVCYDATWPYTNNPCLQLTMDPPASAKAEALLHKALFYYRCAGISGESNLLALKSSLAQGFPVEFGFSCPENFMSAECARTGILHYPGPSESYEGGHAVLLCGYSDNMGIDNVSGAFLVKNSWGVNWGQQGFFWMPYKYFTTSIASDPWTLRRAQV